MRLRLSRITSAADFDYLAPIEFAAFAHDTGHNTMCGKASNPAAVRHLIADHSKSLTSSPEDCWMKVCDDDADGRIVCAAWWKIYPTFVAAEYEQKWREIEATTVNDFAFLDDLGKQRDAVTAVHTFMGSRFKYIKEPHVQLSLLYTDPEYHRRGAGGMMLGWGTQLADHLMLPCWVESSKEGRRLYEAAGFEVFVQVFMELEHLKRKVDYPLRRRPVKAGAI